VVVCTCRDKMEAEIANPKGEQRPPRKRRPKVQENTMA
jgi:hypothetical protein